MSHSNLAIFHAIGATEDSVEGRRRVIAELSTPDNVDGRRAFRFALENTEREYMVLGLESNQGYESSAVIKDGSSAPPSRLDPMIYYHPTTQPGARLPHVWLNKKVPGKRISTLDLCGKGAFTILTGIGGEAWRSASDKVSQELNITIKVWSIGVDQDFEDPHFQWEDLRGTDEDGCVLVRPDLFVAWRVKSLADASKAADAALSVALRQILSL